MNKDKEDFTLGNKLEKINKAFMTYDKSLIPFQLCEICWKTNNLIICEICKNYYHLEVNFLNILPLHIYYHSV
jgi:hypothetical protein